MKISKLTIVLGSVFFVILIALFISDWGIGLYFIATIAIAGVLAFVNESENVELRTRTRRNVTIIVSVFMCYRIFLVSLQYWFLPKFYEFWRHTMYSSFWFMHGLIALAVISAVFLIRYAYGSKARTVVPLVFNSLAILILVYIVARFGYTNLGDEAMNIVSPKTEQFTITLKKGIPYTFDVKENDKLEILDQKYSVYIITAHGDTAIKMPNRNERFLYQSSATTSDDRCGSGEWKLFSKAEQDVKYRLY